MMGTLSIAQIIWSVLLVLVAGVSGFLAARNRNLSLAYVAILLLGGVLMILFPGIWGALAVCAMIVGCCMFLAGRSKNISGKTKLGVVIFLIGTIAFVVAQIMTQPDDDATLLGRTLSYDIAQYEKLGMFAKERYAGMNVVAVVLEGKSARDEQMLKAFEKGYGASVETVEWAPLDVLAFNEENRELKTDNPRRYNALLTQAEIEHSIENVILSSASDADVVLLLVGLPSKRAENLRTLNALKKTRKAKKILLIPNGKGGETEVLAPFIENGLIGAFVMINVKSSIQNDVPENVEEAFNSRFVLVTSENIETMKNDPMLRDPEAENAEE